MSKGPGGFSGGVRQLNRQRRSTHDDFRAQVQVDKIIWGTLYNFLFTLDKDLARRVRDKRAHEIEQDVVEEVKRQILDPIRYRKLKDWIESKKYVSPEERTKVDRMLQAQGIAL